MVGIYSFLCLLLVSASAAATTDTQRGFPPQGTPDAWWQRVENEYVRWWLVEQENRLTALEADPVIDAEKIKNSAARSALGKREVLAVIAGAPKSAPAWMKASVKNLREVLDGRSATPLPETLSRDALAFAMKSHNFPLRDLSASHWRALGTLYGYSARNQLFETAFSTKNAQLDRSPASQLETAAAEIIFVEDGRTTVKNFANRPLLKPFAGFLEASDSLAEAKELERRGFKVHFLKISPLGSVDDQAREFDHVLGALRDSGKVQKPMLLLTSGGASLVVRQWLDLRPERRRDPEFAGWVNYNGRLFGMPLANVPNRGAQRTPASTQDYETFRQFTSPQRQALRPEGPLGRGFPILNLVRLENVAIDNPREAIVPEAETWVIRSPAGKSQLLGAVKYLLKK